jgi:signal peptidase II
VSSQSPSAAQRPDQVGDGAPRSGASKYILFGIIAVVFTVLDQISKIWIQQNVTLYREEIPVISGFLSIVHAENTGAAFGILNDSPYRMWVFAVFTLIALGVLFQMLWQLPNDDRLQTVALGLISSGAVGNAIDRVAKQSVTDFIKVYTDNESVSAFLVDKFGTSQWPSFNIADAAIVIGLGLFFVHFLFFEKDEEVEPNPADNPVGTDVPTPSTKATTPEPAPSPAAASAPVDDEPNTDDMANN